MQPSCGRREPCGPPVVNGRFEDQWWRVDLGSTHQITRIELNWETAYPSRYRIQLSRDAALWTTVLTPTVASPGRKIHTFSARRARYVRIQALTRATQWGISLWDARVYGAPTDAPTPPPPRTCADGTYLAQYWANETLSGDPAISRCEPSVNNTWGDAESPGASVPHEDFSDRYTGRVQFDAADYEFKVTTDDGARVYVDGELVIDQWFQQPPTTYTATRTMTAGRHDIRVEHYDTYLGAVVQLEITKQAAPPDPPPSSDCVPGTVQTLVGSPTEPKAERELLGNTYVVHPNEWNSSAPFAITNDGCLNFRVSRSQINIPLGGGVGAYPSIYKGCLWQNCTSNSGLPLTVTQVRNPGIVKTSTSTTLGAPGHWNSSYDIWFNRDQNPRSSDCSFQPSSTCHSVELMIWLNQDGAGGPAGTRVASNVNIGGRTYNVYRVNGGRWQGDGGIVTYDMTNHVTSVNDLDLAPLATDMVNRGYMTNSHYLTTVMGGFEIVQNGVGLSVNDFDVTVTPR
jgi:PA14 domain/Glycosyl hydrolase family 12/F5/8 type C domain